MSQNGTKKLCCLFKQHSCQPFLVLGTILGEAFAAVHGLVATGLEGNLGGAAATIADHFEHLAFATVVVAIGTTSGAASGAAAGFVLEALFGVEFLFTSREHEFVTTVTAYQRFVLIHFVFPLINMLVSVG